MVKVLTERFVDKLLARSTTGHIRIVTVNNRRYSFREKGTEFGYIDRREACIRLGNDEYVPEDEVSAKAFHHQVAVILGHELEV